ncbi:MAG TPA: ATP-binding protein [Kofleriaceae bacterium]|nr:ATP-binding protein [Kofleriaceae bacterium]
MALTSAVLAALAGAVLTLGVSEIAYPGRRKLDPSSPWIAAWCAAVGLFLIGRYLEVQGDAYLGARLRFFAAVPMASCAVGVVRARARHPLSQREVGWLLIATAGLTAFYWWCELDLVVSLIGIAVVVVGAFSIATLLRSRSLSRGRRLVSLAVVTIITATAVNDILLHLGVIESVHVVEFALVALPLLHNYRLVREMYQVSEEAVADARLARDEAKRSRHQLEHADRLVSLGTMAAGVAHEINNPLSFVTGNLMLMNDRVSKVGDPELMALVREAVDGATRVQRIVRDLKAFSATSRDETEVADLDENVDSALTILNAVLRARATVERVRAPAPRIRVNRLRLGQVLMNLLRNAAEALGDDRARNHIGVVTGTTSAGEAFVTVSDNGPGIPPEVLPRIFEPFFTTKPVGVGTGLGLSICHGIATAMGARIEVESEPGRGARFTLYLPAALPEPAPIAEPVAAPVAASRRRVLIVDDEPIFGRTLGRALKDHDTVVVHRGEEAVELCREETFDLILCDLTMPGMSGVDVYRALADLGQAERVIIVTGGAFTEPARLFLATEPVRRIEKPIDFAMLRKLIDDPRVGCSP